MTIAPAMPAEGPPPGFRPNIGLGVLVDSLLIHGNLCPDCSKPLGPLGGLQRDHDPAIQRRLWDAAKGDTNPPASDPRYIRLRHKKCHDDKTNGPATKAFAQGDKTEIAKTDRLAQKQEDFRRRMLAKGEPERFEEPAKSRWPSRPFPKRPKKGKRT